MWARWNFVIFKLLVTPKIKCLGKIDIYEQLSNFKKGLTTLKKMKCILP